MSNSLVPNIFICRALSTGEKRRKNHVIGWVESTLISPRGDSSMRTSILNREVIIVKLNVTRVIMSELRYWYNNLFFICETNRTVFSLRGWDLLPIKSSVSMSYLKRLTIVYHHFIESIIRYHINKITCVIDNVGVALVSRCHALALALVFGCHALSPS